MRRAKKQLEDMLSTRIRLSLNNEIIAEVPLEGFYHLQVFFRGPIPLDPMSVLCKSPKRKGFNILIKEVSKNETG